MFARTSKKMNQDLVLQTIIIISLTLTVSALLLCCHWAMLFHWHVPENIKTCFIHTLMIIDKHIINNEHT